MTDDFTVKKTGNRKGVILSEETKKKIGLANKGKHHTEEVKKRISEKLKGRKGRKATKEDKIKMSMARKKGLKEGRIKIWNKGLKGFNSGSKSHFWKGGITPKNIIERNSLEYSQWRISVFERDKYTCQICKKVGGSLEAHHIKSFSQYKELRFDIDNGITLCKKCHSEVDFYRRLKKNDK